MPLEFSKGCEDCFCDDEGNYGFLYGLHRGFRHDFILGDERRACIQVTAGKSGIISSQGISVSIPNEAARSGSLSQTYSGKKPPLEVIMESWYSS